MKKSRKHDQLQEEISSELKNKDHVNSLENEKPKEMVDEQHGLGYIVDEEGWRATE